MQITIHAWLIPLLLTAIGAFMILRPYKRCGSYDFGAIFRLFWLIPIAVVWAIYFGVMLWLK